MEDFEDDDYRKNPIKEVIIGGIKFIVPEYLRNTLGELEETIKSIFRDNKEE